MQGWEARASAECAAVEAYSVPQPQPQPLPLPLPAWLQDTDKSASGASDEDQAAARLHEAELLAQFEAWRRSLREEGERERLRVQELSDVTQREMRLRLVGVC